MMSVTVNDVLQLPALVGAKLLTNTAGITRTVTSISVLEYASVTPKQAEINNQLHFEGNELIITSFANIADDVDAQCSNIKRFAAVGEVGLILYYVGILMPQVDNRLIELSNQLGFVLILMPKNDASLAYSSVISDVMQAVFIDQMNNPVFAVDMLGDVAKLPVYNHNLDTVLRMVSDRLHISVSVFDTNNQLIQSANWPKNFAVDWDARLDDYNARTWVNETAPYLYGNIIHSNPNLGDFFLLVLSNNVELDVYARGQVSAAVQIALNLWGRYSAEINQMELLAAIVEDEPIKMRRIAEYYQVDVGKVRSMVVLPQFNTDNYKNARRQLLDLSNEFVDVAIAERYEGNLVILPYCSPAQESWSQWCAALKQWVIDNGMDTVIIKAQNVYTTSLVRKAVQLVQAYHDDVRVIFPEKQVFELGDLEFAQQCREITASGAEKIDNYVHVGLEPFGGDESSDVVHTVQTFLLDAGANVTATAHKLFVHRNTVNYRLEQAESWLGYAVGSMPASMNLYELMGVLRLIGNASS